MVSKIAAAAVIGAATLVSCAPVAQPNYNAYGQNEWEDTSVKTGYDYSVSSDYKPTGKASQWGDWQSTTTSSKWQDWTPTTSSKWQDWTPTTSTKWEEWTPTTSSKWEEWTPTTSSKWEEWTPTTSTKWEEWTSTTSSKWEEWTPTTSSKWEEWTPTTSTKWEEWTPTTSSKWQDWTPTTSSHWEEWTPTTSTKWEEWTPTTSSKWEDWSSATGGAVVTIVPEYTSQYHVKTGEVDFDVTEVEVSKSTSNGGADLTALVTFQVDAAYADYQCQLVFDLTSGSATGTKKAQLYTSLAPATADAASWPSGNLRDQHQGTIDVVVGGRATWEAGSGPAATIEGVFPCSSIAGKIFGGEVVPQGDDDYIYWSVDGTNGPKIIVY